jgi:hypothetical protein
MPGRPSGTQRQSSGRAESLVDLILVGTLDASRTERSRWLKMSLQKAAELIPSIPRYPGQ